MQDSDDELYHDEADSIQDRYFIKAMKIQDAKEEPLPF